MSRMSIYEDDYVPIVVNAPRQRRRRSPIEVGGGNTIYLAPSEGGRHQRAASTGGAAQPINLTVNAPSERSHSRSHSRHRRRDGNSDSDSDDSRRSSRRRHRDRDRDRDRSRRGSRYAEDDYDHLPYHVRKQLDEAEQLKEDQKAKDRAAAAKRDKDQWEAELKDREREEKRKKDRILEEAKEEEARKNKEADDLKKKILEEEDERKKKAKKKKEEEEKEFEEKVRAKFKAAGYSDERIDRVLHDKRKKDDSSDRAWAIDLSRPTFIKVQRKYLHPDTLDYYHLPWEWDKHNTDYIIIKQYIDEDFQDTLFEHTRRLRLKETKLITSSYEKDVKVTLRPADVVKEKDKMYLVREKSKSPGRAASRSRSRSWMFT